MVMTAEVIFLGRGATPEKPVIASMHARNFALQCFPAMPPGDQMSMKTASNGASEARVWRMAWGSWEMLLESLQWVWA